METYLTKAVHGLIPANDEEAEKIKRYKLGALIKCTTSEPANPSFRRKWWALAQVAFDYWSETADMPEHKGQQIVPSFEKFRKDLTILAGHWHPVVRINGDVVREADSLAWASMNNETFDLFYSATINAVLKNISQSKLSEEQLRNTVEEVLSFAT